MITPRSIEFHSTFACSYYRNNRTTGQKSLRCFPTCCERNGHVIAGFCGRPIVTTITFAMDQFAEPSYDHWLNYIFIAEFHPTSSTGLSKEPTLSESQLSLGSPFGHIIRGKMMECSYFVASDGTKIAQLQVIFNSELRSWDYSWRSNRWSGKHETHVLEIAVLKRSATIPTSYDNLLQHSCTPFQVISSKKQSHNRKSEALDDEIETHRLMPHFFGYDSASSRAILQNSPAMVAEKHMMKRKQADLANVGMYGLDSSKRAMLLANNYAISPGMLPFDRRLNYPPNPGPYGGPPPIPFNAPYLPPHGAYPPRFPYQASVAAAAAAAAVAASRGLPLPPNIISAALPGRGGLPVDLGLLGDSSHEESLENDAQYLTMFSQSLATMCDPVSESGSHRASAYRHRLQGFGMPPLNSIAFEAMRAPMPPMKSSVHISSSKGLHSPLGSEALNAEDRVGLLLNDEISMPAGLPHAQPATSNKNEVTSGIIKPPVVSVSSNSNNSNGINIKSAKLAVVPPNPINSASKHLVPKDVAGVLFDGRSSASGQSGSSFDHIIHSSSVF